MTTNHCCTCLQTKRPSLPSGGFAGDDQAPCKMLSHACGVRPGCNSVPSGLPVSRLEALAQWDRRVPIPLGTTLLPTGKLMCNSLRATLERVQDNGSSLEWQMQGMGRGWGQAGAGRGGWGRVATC